VSAFNYCDALDRIRRESNTEKRVRAMDAYDIVQEIHRFEDAIDELEVENGDLDSAMSDLRLELEKAQAENAKLRKVAETAKGFAYEDRTIEKPEWWWLEELRRSLTEAGYEV